MTQEILSSIDQLVTKQSIKFHGKCKWFEATETVHQTVEQIGPSTAISNHSMEFDVRLQKDAKQHRISQ